MANKEFKIQSDTVSLNGVPLSSSTDGKVVIPGVTRATGYRVEEVEDTGDQTYSNFPVDTEGEVVVIDAALYNAIFAELGESGFADFTVTTDGEGYIDEIQINGRGTYTSGNASYAENFDMYAYVGAGSASDRPIVPQDWIQIPFRPKMKSTGIESEFSGGGGGINFDEDDAINLQGVGTIRNEEGPVNLVTNEYAQLQWTTPTGVGEADPNETNEPKNWLYVESGGVFVETNMNTGVGVARSWEFDNDGILHLPEGGDIVDSDGNSVLGGGGGTTIGPMYVVANTDGNIIYSTDGTTFSAPVNTGMGTIGTVAIGPNLIVYSRLDVNGDSDNPGLYSTSSPTTLPTLISGTDGSGNYYFTQIKYFPDAAQPWVAVGLDTTTQPFVPLVMYSTNGVTWTETRVNSGDLASFFSGDSVDLRFTDVQYAAGGWLISADRNNQSGAKGGGLWWTTNITNELVTGQNWIDVAANFKAVESFATSFYSRWQAFSIDKEWWYNNDATPDTTNSWNAFNGGGSTIPAAILSATGLADQTLEEATSGMSSIGNYIWATSSSNGHIVWWANEPAGPWVSVPAPYTGTITDWNSSATSSINISGNDKLSSGEKMTVTGSSVNDYNGTFYVNGSNFVFTDAAMTIPFDTSGFAAFTGTATITWSHGQYIDALSMAGGYLYCANDDEEVYRGVFSDSGSGAIDTVTWTKVNDLNNSLMYWNTIGYYASFVSGGTSSTLTAGDKEVVLNDDGSITFPSQSMTAYQPGYTINGPTLQMGNDPTVGEVIITGPAPDVDNPSARRLIIQGQRGYGSWTDTAVGEGGDIYIWAGTGGENNAGGVGSGGDIKIRGGVGQAGTENGSRTDGGYVKIEGGDVQWGYGTGGSIDINAGSVNTGNNGSGDGGDVNIRAGVGTVNNGTVTIQTSSDGSNYNNSWQFDNGGTLQTNGSVYINGEGRGLIVDYTYKRVGFMKYTGMEASFIHANTHPFQIGRVDGTDITTKGMADFTSEVYISSTGKVGINNSSPVEQLDVDGNIKTSGRLMITGSVPTSSQGAIGDKAGMIAVDASAIYYCIATHGETYIITFVGTYSGSVPEIYQAGVPKPLTGWTFGYNATTYTLTSDAVESNPGHWAIHLDQAISTNANDTTSLTPSANIWVKQAWGTTGSW